MNNILLENETLTRVNENINLIQKKNGLTFGTDAFLLFNECSQQKCISAKGEPVLFLY